MSIQYPGTGRRKYGTDERPHRSELYRSSRAPDSYGSAPQKARGRMSPLAAPLLTKVEIGPSLLSTRKPIYRSSR